MYGNSIDVEKLQVAETAFERSPKKKNKPRAEPIPSNLAEQLGKMKTKGRMRERRVTWLSNGNIQTAVNAWVSDAAAAESEYGHISGWDVGEITDMYKMFYGASNFNSDISKWNVYRVTYMHSMFYGASNFNSDISKWNVAKVSDMSHMFYGASNFNSDISKWNVARVIDMGYMFSSAMKFNSDLSKWNVAEVIDMGYMFADDGSRYDFVSVFNSDISNQDFNQDLGDWNVAGVTYMDFMFLGEYFVQQGEYIYADNKCVVEDGGEQDDGRKTAFTRLYCNGDAELRDAAECTEASKPCDSGECRTHCCTRDASRTYTDTEVCTNTGEVVEPFKVKTTTPRKFSGTPFDDGLLVTNYEQTGINPPVTTVNAIKGMPYTISPLTLDASTTYSSGDATNVTYTFDVTLFPVGFDEATSHSFFIAASTGVMSLTFPTDGDYTIEMLAVDLGNTEDLMETFTFTVTNPATTFEVEVDTNTRSHNDSSFTDPADLKTSVDDRLVCTSGVSYKISAPVLIESGTTVSSGTFDKITYTLSERAPSGWFVQSGTGDIFGLFPPVSSGSGAPKSYSFDLLAVDEGGEMAIVETYNFDVTDPTAFKVETANTRQFSGGTFKDIPKGAAKIHATNVETIRISPLTLDNATTTYSSTSGTSSDVTYTFDVTLFPAGFDETTSHSFFISAKTGVMSLSFPVVGEYAIGLIAIESSSGQTDVMETLAFTVQEPVPDPKKDPTTIIIAAVVSTAFIFVVVGAFLIRHLTNPIRLASMRKNDPLSKIGEYLESNRESLRESVKGTIACKRTFDSEFEGTCMHDFHNNAGNAGNPGLLEALRGIHNRLKAGTQNRVNAKQPLIQPTLTFDFEKDLNGPEHDATRIATQKVYLADLYKMVKTEEPTAYALLEVITNDVLATRPASRFGNSANKIELHRGPLKQMDRILEKADLKKYHFEELRDYGRASWVVDNVSQLPALLQRLEDGNEFDVVRCKNRFDPEYNTKASGGYRDYQLVLRTRIGSESLVAATSPSPSKLEPISCQWLYEVQIMTKGKKAIHSSVALLYIYSRQYEV